MLRVVAVDDEPSALMEISRQIKANANLRLVGVAGSSAEARQIINSKKPDAVFLDIEMPGANAFSVIKTLEIAPKVVFVTGHSQHAAQAFDIEAVDFLLKPILPERFALAVRRVEKAVALDRSVRDIARLPLAESTITVTGQRKQHVIRIKDIRMLLAEGDYTRLLLEKSNSVLSGQSLGTLERLLPSPPFVRLSRSIMLNLARVTSTQSLQSVKISVTCEDRDQPIVLGRAAATKLRQYLAARRTPSAEPGQ
jgi:two-component system, LytTR family, response regulator